MYTDDHCSILPDLYLHDHLLVTICGAVMQTLLGEGAKVVLEGNLQDTQYTAICACFLVFVKKLAAVCMTFSILHFII